MQTIDARHALGTIPPRGRHPAWRTLNLVRTSVSRIVEFAPWHGKSGERTTRKIARTPVATEWRRGHSAEIFCGESQAMRHILVSVCTLGLALASAKALAFTDPPF